MIWEALDNHRGLCKKGQEIRGELGDVTMETEAGGMRRGDEPGNAGGLQQLEKARKWILLGAFRRNTALPTILYFWSPELKGTKCVLF